MDKQTSLQIADDQPVSLESADVIAQNRRVYDQMVAKRQALCRPASSDDMLDPLGTIDPAGWVGGDVHRWRVLCLAAGGGKHGPLFAQAGADVTVVDISGAMLDLDRRAAQQYGLKIDTIQANMQHMPMLADDSFDLVIQPVSTCYVQDVLPVFSEIARVLRSGGLYISNHKQPTSLQGSVLPDQRGQYWIEHTYYRSQAVPAPQRRSVAGCRLREDGAVEYLHRWEELVGGICRSGMLIEDLVEPLHGKAEAPPGSFAYRAAYIAPYVCIKARRVERTGGTKARLIL